MSDSDPALKAAAKALESAEHGPGERSYLAFAQAAITAYLSASLPQGQERERLIEQIARIINPIAFKSHEAMIAYSLRQGDDPEEAQRLADWSQGKDIADAIAKATTILSTLYQGS